MTVSTRPRKRNRTVACDEQKQVIDRSTWDDGLLALVDRLDTIRSRAVALRDEHIKTIAELDDGAALRKKAKRAIAKATISSKENDLKILSKATEASTGGSLSEATDTDAKPTPAVKLLMETEPPDKVIHEQSIIVRAQAINRKNAELARERLPKQPEAQRNKTHHDYYLDEVLWMATDFKEERKLKIHLARKVSRMVVQFHAQRQRRTARAELEAHQRILKLASTVAKEVRRFWNQIGEVADYRTALVEEARQTQERELQLKQLVQQTDQFAKKMAKSLKDPSQGVPQLANGSIDETRQAGVLQRNSEQEMGTERTLQTVQESVDQGGGSHRQDLSVDSVPNKNPSKLESTEINEITNSRSGSEKDYDEADGNELDDESTLVAAEAEEDDNPEEVQTLADQASMSVEELLRSQGIDPSAYQADTKDYLTASEGDVSDTSMDEDIDTAEDEDDNESTIAAAEAEDANDTEEGRRLQDENQKSVEELLRLQGIDPKVYFADKKNYLNEETECNTARQQPEATKAQVKGENEVNGGSTDVTDVEKSSERNSPDIAGNGDPHSSHPNESKLQLPSQLLRGILRSYQQTGMEWLISLHKQNLNGILADEMGLGKTIQTIALLAWLALDRGVWGPHLIVVPTSVMVNWEVEFKKWLPGFKIMTYFGSMKERKLKRQGWTKPNLFHVCITSYRLAVQDATILRRKKWVYLILDEAHNIKNFESQRWQTLLSFSSQRRLLITGTPLQNSVMELWSLMHFLTPEVFRSHSEFKDWFSKPLVEAAEAQGKHNADRAKIVASLHRLLRPFLLRRLKADVEKGLPPKFEHVIKCHLSKRQRQLYEDFISRSDVKETLQSGNVEGIVGVLIQLKKVCNHPDLFEGRPILSPFSMSAVFFPVPSIVPGIAEHVQERFSHLPLLNLDMASMEGGWAGAWYRDEAERISSTGTMKRCSAELQHELDTIAAQVGENRAATVAKKRRISARRSNLNQMVLVNAARIRKRALLGEDLRSVVTLTPRSLMESLRLNKASHDQFLPQSLPNISRSVEEVALRAKIASERFVCCITKASAPLVEMRYRGDDMAHRQKNHSLLELNRMASAYRSLFRSYEVRSKVTIPDTRLIQWDCGKLQIMARLLRQLRAQNSRVLIFTQMAKVLDVLESFLNLHSYRYLRLDGTTKPDDRQKIVERFNADQRVFCMILTTRAGGVGLNLTGANSVIFYDTDYNPAIDNQAQDRAHRIGQTKPVNVYRLVSEQTVEENILKRANEKRLLETAVISDARFTTDAIAERERPSSSSALQHVRPDAVLKGTVSRGTNEIENVMGSESREGLNQEIRAAGGIGKVGPSGPSLQSAHSGGPKGVKCAYGTFDGFYTQAEQSLPTATEDVSVRNIDEYQEVTARILAKEDEREKLALHMAEQEEKELRAEFEESKPHEAGYEDTSSTVRKSVTKDYDKLKSSLTPIQLYALRLLENWQEADRDPNESFGDPATTQNQCAIKSGDEVFMQDEGTMFEGEQDLSMAPEKDANPIFYELDVTQAGQLNYLKVLTDTDADIKLYLPLRDGGPEELKVSSVVSGTAAAGLECAEDAAFFPHAYNRMSRTPFATRRQREKGLANFRKRKAEKEAKKQRELQIAAVNAAAAVAGPSQKSVSASQAPVSQQRALQMTSTLDRSKSTKRQNDPSRSGGSSFSRKQRLEILTKSKPGSATGSFSSGEAVHNPSMGLFRRPNKRNVRRLTMPGGKSSLGSSTTGMPGDGLGVNDGWTTEEDQQLISAAAEFNNNMVLVADLLSSDPRVAAGLRRYRSHTHCIDRLINCLGKDKSGPPSAKAASSDRDVLRNHLNVMERVLSETKERPPSWMVLPPTSVDLHASHKKAIAEAATKMKAPSKKNGIPPLKAVFQSYEIPKHYRPGHKTTETTPQAMNKLRFPFLRPPRDDPRALQQRGAGQPSRYNGAPSGQGPLHRGDPNLFSKVSQKAQRSQQQSSAHRNISQGRNNAAARMTQPVRGRSDVVGVRNVGTAQHSSSLPTSLHPSRRGYFVPGTGGRISIGQYGNTVQHVPTAHAYTPAQPKVGSLKPSVPAVSARRVTAPVTSLKPGIRKAAPSKLATSVSSLKSGGPSTTARAQPQSQGHAVAANDMVVTKSSTLTKPNGVSNAKGLTTSSGAFISGQGIQHQTHVNLTPEQPLVRSNPERETDARGVKTPDSLRAGGSTSASREIRSNAVDNRSLSDSTASRGPATDVSRVGQSGAARAGASQKVGLASASVTQATQHPSSKTPDSEVRKSPCNVKGGSQAPTNERKPSSLALPAKPSTLANISNELKLGTNSQVTKPETTNNNKEQKAKGPQLTSKSDSDIEKR